MAGERSGLLLREAFGFAYDLTRTNESSDVPYGGYDIGRDERAGSFSPAERLTAEQLRYDELDQGRDAATVILGLAVQLGVEQGRRIQQVRQAEIDRASRYEMTPEALERLRGKLFSMPVHDPAGVEQIAAREVAVRRIWREVLGDHA